MTFNNFVANVGGLFGLWLGPSLVTLFKIIYEMVKMICLRRKYRAEVLEKSLRNRDYDAEAATAEIIHQKMSSSAD